MLEQTVNFLSEIGLSIVDTAGANGFIPGVNIINGVLHVDMAVATPSAILHEASHLAIIPGSYRGTIQSDVDVGIAAMFDDIKRLGLWPDHPLYWAALHSGDQEATAHAFAMGVHIGLPIESIIEDHEYGGNGAEVRFMVSSGHYSGIHGLAHAGFCAINSKISNVSGIPVYPRLKMWLQHAHFDAQQAVQ